jgi:hypothetical protein
MAVKGKKKSQSRGSQGRRRPATAPRAAYASRAREPWYRTPRGQAIAALVLLIALVVIVAVVRSGSNGTDLTNRQNAIDQYTGDVRALLQSITPAATAENGVPNKLNAKQAKALKKASQTWLSEVTAAQQSAGKVVAPTPATQSANIAFVESIQLYGQAASIYGLVSSTSPAVQAKLLVSGGNLRNQASALWQEGINILDQARSTAKMPPSQLRLPTAGAVAPPSPSPSPSAKGNKKHHKKHDKGGGQGSK